MQSICGNARYTGKCKVHVEMQGIYGNARYMWKYKVHVDMLVKAEMQVADETV